MSQIYNDSYKFYRLVLERCRLNESEEQTAQSAMVSAGNSSAERRIDDDSSSVEHQSNDDSLSANRQINGSSSSAEHQIDDSSSSAEHRVDNGSSSTECQVDSGSSSAVRQLDDSSSSAKRREDGTDWMVPGSAGSDHTGLDIPMTRAADDNKENTEPKGSAGGSSEEADTEGDEADRGSTSKEPSEEEKSSDDKETKPKKNRCAVCRKKVGLTGFLCRCGGLFCAVHRYSDKHDCTFDYRELGAQEIRRNNPVVVGEKIKKI